LTPRGVILGIPKSALDKGYVQIWDDFESAILDFESAILGFGKPPA
jgi:hypothetical protein